MDLVLFHTGGKCSDWDKRGPQTPVQWADSPGFYPVPEGPGLIRCIFLSGFAQFYPEVDSYSRYYKYLKIYSCYILVTLNFDYTASEQILN